MQRKGVMTKVEVYPSMLFGPAGQFLLVRKPGVCV